MAAQRRKVKRGAHAARAGRSPKPLFLLELTLLRPRARASETDRGARAAAPLALWPVEGIVAPPKP